MRTLIAIALLAGLAACDDSREVVDNGAVAPVDNGTTSANDECPRDDGQPCR